MDPNIEKKRLAITDEPELLDEARPIMIEARRRVALGPSVITSIVLGLCHFVFTRAIDTFAVKLAGDGQPMLMVNPEFLKKIGADQAVFALSHEAYHLIMLHLHADPALMQNDNWITATEACINERLVKHLKLPLIQVDGKVAIVDPGKIYERYRDSMKEAGLPVASRDDFYATDLGCLTYLEQAPKPIKRGNRGSSTSGCVHSDGGSGDDSQAPLDPSEVQKFMEKVLSGAVQAAKNGRAGAKEEILEWMDSSPESSQMWGDLGAGFLRGETTRSRKTDMWEKWTQDAMASRMAEGTRWRYNKKLPWDPRVAATGRQPRKHGAVFVDASGSMSQGVLDRVAAMIGDIDNVEVEWHSFDGAVWPFVIGEGFKGGGGTSFQVIDDHLLEGGTPDTAGEACCDEEQDFVLVITDGYAPHIVPRDDGKWIWLITPGGDSWPQDAGMSCREIDLDAAGV